MVVGPQVANPQILGSEGFTCRLAVEEQHVSLEPLGVEDARGQPEQRVNVSLRTLGRLLVPFQTQTNPVPT